MGDGAAIRVGDRWLVMTADAHVVAPIFFPGGDIGRLSVSGVVNDLAVMGACEVAALTSTVVVEEGFSLADLRRIHASMQAACAEAGTKIITGDTKVMRRGELDGIVLSTSGVGFADRVVRDSGLAPGDAILVTGTLGDHGLAVLSARHGLGLEGDLRSDVAPLNGLVRAALAAGGEAVRDEGSRPAGGSPARWWRWRTRPAWPSCSTRRRCRSARRGARPPSCSGSIRSSSRTRARRCSGVRLARRGRARRVARPPARRPRRLHRDGRWRRETAVGPARDRDSARAGSRAEGDLLPRICSTDARGLARRGAVTSWRRRRARSALAVRRSWSASASWRASTPSCSRPPTRRLRGRRCCARAALELIGVPAAWSCRSLRPEHRRAGRSCAVAATAGPLTRAEMRSPWTASSWRCPDVHACGCGDTERVPVELHEKILAGNDRRPGTQARALPRSGVLALNLMGSPGAGKTAVLEATAGAVGATGCGSAAVAADLATDNDARRLAAAGSRRSAITTGQACHLDARAGAPRARTTAPGATTDVSSSRTSATSSARRSTTSARRRTSWCSRSPRERTSRSSTR